MPITVSYCRNDLRKNDLYITSKSGGRLAPGCANTVVLDVEVVVYSASGYLDFTWEQIYGPPVTLTYPDPLDLTRATFPYTADGYERKFRFWVNAGISNVYKRAYYDIIVGDNFYERATLTSNNDTLTTLDRDIYLIKDRGYNIFYNGTVESSKLFNSSNSEVGSTGSTVWYAGLSSYDYKLTAYLGGYFSNSVTFPKFPSSELEWLGHRATINIDNKTYSDSVAQYGTTTYYSLLTQLFEESSTINVDNRTSADALTTWTTEYKNILYQDLVESWTINIHNYTSADTYVTTVTIGAGVIDL